MSILYVVATPIGNLSDISHRAIKCLQKADFVACEDTRRAKILFDKWDINTPRISCHAQSSDAKRKAIVERIKKGEIGCYISDAGTPCISDPGQRLIQKCIQNGVRIIPITGACALTTLISASGVPSSPLIWHGFLPHKKGRKTLFETITQMEKYGHAGYESVHRIQKMLNSLVKRMPERYIVIGREMTKMHEEFFRGSVKEAFLHFEENTPRGEFAFIIAPKNYKS